MSRLHHDQFTKQCAEELLSPIGQVQINREVPGEPHAIDIYFTPHPEGAIALPTLGILGRMARQPCLIEPFSTGLTGEDIEGCLLKLMGTIAEIRREARRAKRRLLSEELPQLWMVAPTVSAAQLARFGAKAKKGWPRGVYEVARGWRLQVVVIHQLPPLPETLWLRLWGRGKVQRQAIEEVLALPDSDPKRIPALKLLATWKITIEVSGALDQEDQEVAMALSQAYLEWEKQTEERGVKKGMQRGIQQGMQQGIQQGVQQGVERVALNMLQKGMLVEEVAQLTSLTVEQIQALQQDCLSGNGDRPS